MLTIESIEIYMYKKKSLTNCDRKIRITIKMLKYLIYNVIIVSYEYNELIF